MKKIYNTSQEQIMNNRRRGKYLRAVKKTFDRIDLIITNVATETELSEFLSSLQKKIDEINKSKNDTDL